MPERTVTGAAQITGDSILLRVGTRDSQLARLQTDLVIEALAAKFPELIFEIVPITTGGDKVLDKPIADIGGRGVFVKELEEALYINRVDFVVHSLKDLPTDLPASLTLVSVLNRLDARDVLVSKGNVPFEKLAKASKVATSSRRRSAQLKAVRPDLQFCDIRGNIPTRMRKFEAGECDAMILAASGLIRLGMADCIAEYLDIELCTPAAGQGALAVESRLGDRQVVNYLSAIDDRVVRNHIAAERACLDKLGGGCSVPVGVFGETLANGMLRLTGCVASLDGAKVIRTSIDGVADTSIEMGKNLAARLQELGADEILQKLRQTAPAEISPP